MTRKFPWNTLGIDRTQDTGAIRRAYADALRAINVDADIAGYAKLRSARDEALWLAAQAARNQNDGGDESTGDYGLGSIDDDEPDGNGAGLAEDWDAGDRSAEDWDADFDGAGFGGDLDRLHGDHSGWQAAPQRFDPTPIQSDDQSDAQGRAQAAWQALSAVLYPYGGLSDDSVTHAEHEDGLTQLGVLLAHAEQIDIAEHDALDSALADLFARTWPRSAPFVEAANAAMHWLDEAGQLDERPALTFLNARIKGMRFHEKVQAADHPLHRAWSELSRPGSASWIDRLRVKRLDIDKLLTGLRRHYPELESHLDPQRVASWEGAANASGVSDTGPKVVRGFVIVMLVLFVPRLISSLSDADADDPGAPVAEAVAALNAAQTEAAVTSIFGEGVGMAGVRVADPVFADQFSPFASTSGSDADALKAFTRRKALEAGEVADFDALVVRAQLRRMWLGAAQRQSAAVCPNVLAGDFDSIPLALSNEERARERPLLRALLDAQVLRHQAKGGASQFAIPGWAVSEIITRSGLDQDAVVAAFADTASPNRCNVEIALLDVVLANPGRVSPELLRGL